MAHEPFAAFSEREDPDAELVARAKKGDGEAFDALVERHHAAVFRAAFAIVSGEDEAADAAQGTFLKALVSLGGFRGDSLFRTWLLRIAANEARALRRRVLRRREVPMDAVAQGADDGASRVESALGAGELVRLEAALARLPEKQRMAVTLRIYEGLSFREVGEVIGSSEGAARVNYHHGIKKLREWLQ